MQCYINLYAYINYTINMRGKKGKEIKIKMLTYTYTKNRQLTRHIQIDKLHTLPYK